jgi:hypothetical protein
MISGDLETWAYNVKFGIIMTGLDVFSPLTSDAMLQQMLSYRKLTEFLDTIDFLKVCRRS